MISIEKIKNNKSFLARAVLVALVTTTALSSVDCSFFMGSRSGQSQRDQVKTISETEETSALRGLHVSFACLFQKISAEAIPFLSYAISHPFKSIPEQIVSIVEQTPVSASVAQQSGGKITSWNNLMSDIIRGFFPKNSTSDLRREDSALGNIVDGVLMVCDALDGQSGREGAEEGIRAVYKGVNRLKTEYLRGTEPKTNVSPRVQRLNNERGEFHTDYSVQGRYYYDGVYRSGYYGFKKSPRGTFIKGLKTALRGYCFKRNIEKVNEGIEMMIDAILRLNFQHLGEETH